MAAPDTEADSTFKATTTSFVSVLSDLYGIEMLSMEASAQSNSIDIKEAPANTRGIFDLLTIWAQKGCRTIDGKGCSRAISHWQVATASITASVRVSPVYINQGN